MDWRAHTTLSRHQAIIGMGEFAVSADARVTLSTFALGSCIAVIAYNPTQCAGGLWHFMLPDSTLIPNRSVWQPALFADSGLRAFLKALRDDRRAPGRHRLYLTGGACVLGGPDTFKIGARNVTAIKALLIAAGEEITGEDLGGTINRSAHLELATGRVTLKTPGEIKQFSLA